MKVKKSLAGLALVVAATFACVLGASAEDHHYRHVLLISVDGMHAIDLENCSKGLSSIKGGSSYCPNLAELLEHGVKYTAASTSKPSDSFPGLTALVTGAEQDGHERAEAYQ